MVEASNHTSLLCRSVGGSEPERRSLKGRAGTARALGEDLGFEEEEGEGFWNKMGRGTRVGSTGAWTSGPLKLSGFFKSQRGPLPPMSLTWVRPCQPGLYN